VRAGAVAVGFRPEAIKPEAGRAVEGRCRVRLIENLGGELVVHLDAKGSPLIMSFPVSERAVPVFDSEIPFGLELGDILLFDPADGRRLPY
jgi:ABC-type sugar transport system ATPase subunit